jgi:hypothetical protein
MSPGAADDLTAATARLTTRYGAHLPAATISDIVQEVYRSLLARATVTTYVPLLAERAAAARLADLVSSAQTQRVQHHRNDPRTAANATEANG